MPASASVSSRCARELRAGATAHQVCIWVPNTRPAVFMPRYIAPLCLFPRPPTQAATRRGAAPGGGQDRHEHRNRRLCVLHMMCLGPISAPNARVGLTLRSWMPARPLALLVPLQADLYRPAARPSAFSCAPRRRDRTFGSYSRGRDCPCTPHGSCYCHEVPQMEENIQSLAVEG